jgi:hypothetical protein
LIKNYFARDGFARNGLEGMAFRPSERVADCWNAAPAAEGTESELPPRLTKSSRNPVTTLRVVVLVLPDDAGMHSRSSAFERMFPRMTSRIFPYA